MAKTKVSGVAYGALWSITVAGLVMGTAALFALQRADLEAALELQEQMPEPEPKLESVRDLSPGWINSIGTPVCVEAPLAPKIEPPKPVRRGR